jgi:hypothetical protein
MRGRLYRFRQLSQHFRRHRRHKRIQFIIEPFCRRFQLFGRIIIKLIVQLGVQFGFHFCIEFRVERLLQRGQHSQYR